LSGLALSPPAGVLAALVLEALIGYPAWLQRRLPHPVVAVGVALDGLERRWNRPMRSERARKGLGVCAVAVLVGAAIAVGGGLDRALKAPDFKDQVWGFPIWVAIATVGLAQKSLHQHVAAVAGPLAARDLGSARAAVAQIVGRDVERLDASGVSAAALESLAESFSDGIVAPAFWLLVGGLAGLFAYKVVNTADSMIGHLEPRYRAFGWAAARTDDLMNLIPARLAGALIALAGAGGWGVMVRYAPRHASPNAGWPEAAMAGALGLQLGGPAVYDGATLERPSFGAGRPAAAEDVRRGLAIYRRACALLWVLLAAGALLWRA
jgi:adenosylcobinamide-phosphate synthase